MMQIPARDVEMSAYDVIQEGMGRLVEGWFERSTALGMEMRALLNEDEWNAVYKGGR